MKTVLWDRHQALGAKMVNFFGWEMPISYKGIVHEHLTVRHKVGLFDVSHMGRIGVRGVDAEKFLDFLSTNALAGVPDWKATYSVLPSASGGCVDDVLIYKRGIHDFFLVANASNREKDLQHLQKYAASFNVTIEPYYNDEGILAIQGPLAKTMIGHEFGDAAALKAMHFTEVDFQGTKVIISRTGYTGSDGYEVFASKEVIVALWDFFIKAGEPFGLEPIGLGARDTLRLEMGFALYGHEISEEIAATESVSAWTVKWEKEFLGKEKLLQLEHSPDKRSEYGVVLADKGIAREGFTVFKGEQPIGRVTSGTFSPILNQPIAIILVTGSWNVGERVEVQIRNHRSQGQIVLLPFYQKVTKGKKT